MQFDRVIGLGGNCEVAQHIRRHFETDHAHIFDWWITPFQGAVTLLASDFKGLFGSEDMTVVGDRLAVKCRRTGVIFHHDFPRDAQELVIREEIEPRLPELRAKYDALRRRLDAACEGDATVLFVRSWREIFHAPPSYPQHLIDGVPDYDFRRLIETIERRYRKLDFRVLFVNYGPQRIEHPRAIFDNVADKGDTVDWSGSPGGWSELFDRHRDVPILETPSGPEPGDPAAPTAAVPSGPRLGRILQGLGFAQRTRERRIEGPEV